MSNCIPEQKVSEMFCQNVRYLCKKYGYGVGKMERDVGVSQGFLSRKDRAISLDTAWEIAFRLCHPLSDLCQKDFAKNDKLAELDAQIVALQEERKRLHPND